MSERGRPDYRTSEERPKGRWKPVALLGRARPIEGTIAPPAGHVDAWGQVWERHTETPVRGDLPAGSNQP